MTIATFDQYIAAPKQIITITKTGALVSTGPFFNIDAIAQAGSITGTLAGTSTLAGVVPTSGVAGFPIIATGGSTPLYLTGVRATANLSGNILIYDCLYKAGPYLPVTTTNVTAPSFASRIPLYLGVPNYGVTELWVECVTAYTGVLSVNITYTNQSGTAGRVTGVISTALSGAVVGRMFRVPLASGDTGIQSIQSVVTSGATAGTTNVLILRELWNGRIGVNTGSGTSENLASTGMPELTSSAALLLVQKCDSAANMAFNISIEIAG